MSRCTHNDHSPELEPCKNEGVGKNGYCVEHGCCLCGRTMLADTEDWKVYLCFECYLALGLYAHSSRQRDMESLINAAYEAGRRAVIGEMEPDEVVEGAR